VLLLCNSQRDGDFESRGGAFVGGSAPTPPAATGPYARRFPTVAGLLCRLSAHTTGMHRTGTLIGLIVMVSGSPYN
jgi:hypothetical protein